MAEPLTDARLRTVACGLAIAAALLLVVSPRARAQDFGTTAAPNDPYAASISNGGDTHMVVTSATGGLSIAERPDLLVPGPMPLYIQRFYDSMDAQTLPPCPLGDNWHTNFDWQLFAFGNAAIVADGRGLVMNFFNPGTGWVRQRPTQLPFQLVQNGPNYVLSDPRDQHVITFDAATELATQIDDGHGNRQLLGYTGGLLTQVMDGKGRALFLNYDLNRHLSGVTDGIRTVTYNHVGNQLASVQDAAGGLTGYLYTPTATALLTSETLPTGDVPWVITYTANGRVSTQTDASGNTWTYSYAWPTITLTDPTNAISTWKHNPDLTVQLFTDARNRVTSCTYDGLSRPITGTRWAGDVTQWSWDLASGFLASQTLPGGAFTHWTYQPRVFNGTQIFDLVRRDDPDGAFEVYSRNANGDVTQFTDRGGFNWGATYNAHGLPLTITIPTLGVTTLTYDLNHNLSTSQDNAGNITTHTYDALDRCTLVTFAGLTQRHVFYDAFNRISGMTDENGHTWSVNRDAAGRPTVLTDPDGLTTRMFYDSRGNIIDMSDALNHHTTFTWDTRGLFDSATDPTHRVTIFAHDACGDVNGITNSGGSTWLIDTDPDRRPYLFTDPVSATATITYDGRDEEVLFQDPLHNLTQFAHSAMGWLTGLSGPLGFNYGFGYSPLGDLNSITAPIGHVGLARTPLGDIASLTDALSSVWLETHDAQGRLTSVGDPLGNVTGVTYNTRNQPSTITLPLGTETLAHDAATNLTRRSYSDGTTIDYAYNARDQLIGTTGVTLTADANGNITQSSGIIVTRDDSGRLLSENFASITYTATLDYYPSGRPAHVRDWTGVVTLIEYGADGRPIRITYPNGVVENLAYDGMGACTAVNYNRGASTIYSSSITRNALGQITSADRVLPIAPVVYTGSIRHTYNAASEIVGVQYDAMERPLNDGLRTFQWDLASRATLISEGAVTATAFYDGFDRIVTHNYVGGSTTQFVWNYATDQPSLGILRVNGTDQRYFIWTPDGNHLLYSIDALTGAHLYYHPDEFGNIVATTNDAGAIVSRYAYSPFGKILASQNDDPNELFTFGGEFGAMREGTTGLYRVRTRVIGEDGLGRWVMRLYDSDLGRIVSSGQLVDEAPPVLTIPLPDPGGAPPAIAFHFSEPIGFVAPRVGLIYDWTQVNGEPPSLRPAFDGAPLSSPGSLTMLGVGPINALGTINVATFHFNRPSWNIHPYLTARDYDDLAIHPGGAANLGGAFHSVLLVQPTLYLCPNPFRISSDRSVSSLPEGLPCSNGIASEAPGSIFAHPINGIGLSPCDECFEGSCFGIYDQGQGQCVLPRSWPPRQTVVWSPFR